MAVKVVSGLILPSTTMPLEAVVMREMAVSLPQMVVEEEVEPRVTQLREKQLGRN